GIHPPADDFAGRRVGSEVGKGVWKLARQLFDGTVINSEVNLTSRKLDDNNMELRFNAVRGLYYKVHSSANVAGPYSDGGAAGQVALEASVATTNSLSDPRKFFRVSASLLP